MNKVYRLILSVAAYLLLGAGLFAQNQTTPQDIWNGMPRFKTLPQEKLYLHFDKPCYVAGDRMWFRAYLVNANTHQPDTASCAVYVELTNSCDSLVRRVKIPCQKGVYSGSILLNEESPEGVYTVRAYTNWMQNIGNDFFYHKQIYIGNSISSKVKSSISYSFVNEKKIAADIYFSQQGSPLASKKMTYYLNLSGKNKSPKIVTTNVQGKIHVEYNPQQIDIKKPILHVTYQENMSKYDRNYILPAKNNFDVQFFPEGGELISGASNCIAFKAIQFNGFSTEIKGTVFDNTNNKISEFKSSHLGMGKFYLLPEKTKKYYAIVENISGGDKKRIDLPTVKQQGTALEASFHNNKIHIGIKHDNSQDSLFLLAHSRGSIFYNKAITDLNEAVVFNPQELRPGIISFLLLNKNNEPISERLVFIKPQKAASSALQFDKPDYESREKVNCAVHVTDAQGNPASGSFSVATTDASDVELDSLGENITNTLLLSSDLKGYIENPNQYFDPNFKQGDEALDVLMMTQGWKRFNVSSLLKGDKETATDFLEKGQAISGSIKAGLLNKREKGTTMTMLAPSIKYFGMQETDENGKFMFGGFSFPDSTKFTIQAKRKRGIKDAVEITLDQDTFPAIQEEIIRPEKAVAANDNQLETASEKFIYENGMFNFNLKAVEVVARREVETETMITDPNYLMSTEQYELSGNNLNRFKDQPFSMLIKSLPGLQNWNEGINANSDAQIYGDSQTVNDDPGPHFAWDGNIYSYTDVERIDVNDLLSVQVLRSNMAIVSRNHSSMDDILIVLNFKKDRNIFSSRPKPDNIATIMPLGYAKSVTFYQPKYDVDSIRKKSTPDLRSTICWLPELKTDANGNGSFWFYTADRASKYNIVVEGVLPNGETCHTEVKKILFKNTSK
ncbi:MAG: hypothetical protein P4L28_09605 [Paludibacteraceae bacterium]|nr:hypothetical protein [Paludibacteraceae bacterium]